MSVASRERDAARRRQLYCDRHLRGFPSLAVLRAWQHREITPYLSTPEALARRALVDAEWTCGRVAVAPGSDTFAEAVSIPEPLMLDIAPQPA